MAWGQRTGSNRIAALLGIDVAKERVDELVKAATFESMRANGDRLAPDPSAVLLDKSRFFRSGQPGAGTDALSSPLSLRTTPVHLERHVCERPTVPQCSTG